MYACPNCGGNLKFDIPSQQLACEYCHTQADPYSFDDKDRELFEQKEYEATLFTCPQCGGEILSTDTSAAEFCSFCGASTILHGRLVNEKRPNYIIPFKQTKEDCKKAYSKMMRKAIFAPKALKDPKYIDGFRGIYMPYWAFHLTQQDHFSLKGKRSHRRGDYIITDHYDINGSIDAYYKGLSYDASSSFDDNISEKIAPYDVKAMKEFTPAYLSGFYADTADVPSSAYEEEAKQLAFDQSLKKIYSSPKLTGLSIQSENSNRSRDAILRTDTAEIDNAMFPVWFMSYRNGDRVTYATINGQTGKVVSDLPIDTRKYLLGSLILALPIFVLLNLFFTIIPTSLLTLTAFIALITNILYTIEILQILKKEKGIKKKKPTVKPKRSMNLGTIVFCIVVGIVFIFILSTSLDSLVSSDLPWIVITACGAISTVAGIRKKKELGYKKVTPGFITSLAAIVVGMLIHIFNPISDLFYYSGAIFTLLAVFFTIKDIIYYYNILSTRKLPQFDRTGGDDRA